MGRAGKAQVTEKITVASWLVSSQLTLDDAVSEVSAVAHHAETLQALIPTSRRRPAWAQHTATYIDTLDWFVDHWRRRFADETASWDEARLVFLADIEDLREARAVLVDALAGRPHIPAAAVADPTPHPVDQGPEPMEQMRQEPEPNDEGQDHKAVDDEGQEHKEPADEREGQDHEVMADVLPWPGMRTLDPQQDAKREAVSDGQDQPAPVSLWPGLQSELKKPAAIDEREGQEHEEPADEYEAPVLPPSLPPVAAFAPASPATYRVEDMQRLEHPRLESSRVRVAVMAVFVAAAVAGAGYVAMAASGSTKSTATVTAPRTAPKPSPTAPTPPSSSPSTPAPSTSSTTTSDTPRSVPKPPPPATTSTTKPPAPSSTSPAPTSHQPPQPTTTAPPRPPHTTTTRPPSSGSVTGISVTISGGNAGAALDVHIHVTTSGTGSITVSATVAGSQTYGRPGSVGRQSQSRTLSGATSYNIDFSYDGFAFCGSPYVGAQASAGGHSTYTDQSDGC